MSKLFSRSKTQYKIAKRNMMELAEDDSMLDATCFCAQQSLEFALKYIFELNGLQHPWGHDIGDLIKSLEVAGLSCPAIVVFKDKANMYTSWETETRYKDSFLAVISDVQECLSNLCALHEYIEKTMQCSTYVESEVLEWCRANAPDALKQLSEEELLQHMLPLYDKYAR